MMNAVTINEEMVWNNSYETMQQMVADAGVMAASTLDEVFESFKKYLLVTKEEFKKLTDYAEALLFDMEQEDEISKRPLTELELDMVAGGWIGSKIWNGAKNVVSKVADSVKDTWNNGGVIGKIGVVAAGVGLALVGVAGAAVATGAAVAGSAVAAAATAAEIWQTEVAAIATGLVL